MACLPFIWFAIIGIIIIFMIKKKGFKGAMFGGEILSTSKQIKLSKASMTTGHISVHTLDFKGRTNIGIEIVQKGPLSYDMTPLNLAREDAIELMSELSLAIESSEPVDGGQ